MFVYFSDDGDDWTGVFGVIRFENCVCDPVHGWIQYRTYAAKNDQISMLFSGCWVYFVKPNLGVLTVTVDYLTNLTSVKCAFSFFKQKKKKLLSILFIFCSVFLDFSFFSTCVGFCAL